MVLKFRIACLGRVHRATRLFSKPLSRKGDRVKGTDLFIALLGSA